MRDLNVPTLSEWGMISAALGLGLIGVFFAVKRLRASKQSDAQG
ncbi:MAG: IPTL-CTERM sorting domain-containing protein [Thermodesulfobacteriota bacterium]